MDTALHFSVLQEVEAKCRRYDEGKGKSIPLETLCHENISGKEAAMKGPRSATTTGIAEVENPVLNRKSGVREAQNLT
jgi:hypothetical protein